MTKPEPRLEILIATLNRSSLDFLDVMFQNNDLSKHSILIVNQTNEENILKSNQSHIRVINSFEKGLSKSRNLAIDNAIGDICLLADDDAIYLKGFEKIILESYENQPQADVITFKTLTTENKPFYKYPKQSKSLGAFSEYVLSIEISFKKAAIKNGKIRYDEQFGLGATFQDSENYIFLKQLQDHTDLNLYFVSEFIVIHKPFTSSDEINSDRFVFARSALNYKLYKQIAYFWLVKYLFFLLRNNYIGFSEISAKWKVGLNGIKTYKGLKVN